MGIRSEICEHRTLFDDIRECEYGELLFDLVWDPRIGDVYESTAEFIPDWRYLGKLGFSRICDPTLHDFFLERLVRGIGFSEREPIIVNDVGEIFWSILCHRVCSFLISHEIGVGEIGNE